MKLQKQKAYVYNDKVKYKYVVVIPEKIINELGWQGGQPLITTIENRKLIIKKINNI